MLISIEWLLFNKLPASSIIDLNMQNIMCQSNRLNGLKQLICSRNTVMGLRKNTDEVYTQTTSMRLFKLNAVFEWDHCILFNWVGMKSHLNLFLSTLLNASMLKCNAESGVTDCTPSHFICRWFPFLFLWNPNSVSFVSWILLFTTYATSNLNLCILKATLA